MSENLNNCGVTGNSIESVVFVKSYTNRWGQEMNAEDYGIKAFVFSKKPKKGRKKLKKGKNK